MLLSLRLRLYRIADWVKRDEIGQSLEAPGSNTHVDAILWNLAAPLARALDGSANCRWHLKPASRHAILSCVETGRAQPSREMVLRLAETLEIPLRRAELDATAAGLCSSLSTRQATRTHQRWRRRVKPWTFLLRQQEPLSCGLLSIAIGTF